MPCDLSAVIASGYAVICDDDRLRGLVQLSKSLAERGRPRESAMILRRIAQLLELRGIAGERPFFSLDEGSTCRLAGNTDYLFFTPSGQKSYRWELSLHCDLNQADSRRFPRAPLQEPSLFCASVKSGPSCCPSPRTPQGVDRSPLSTAEMQAIFAEAVVC